MAQKPNQLGRGLAALLGESNGADLQDLDKVRALKPVPIAHLHPGKYQPRRIINMDHIDELAASIRDKGIIQPIVVRRHPDKPSEYEIIAGERRWRAAQRAELHEVPIVVKEFSDVEALEVALIENLQRQDLSPLEEAEGYQRLIEEFGHTQEVMARSIGKSRSHVANMVRLIALPREIKDMLDDGRLSAGHARALLAAEDPVTLAENIVARGLNVRETEQLVKARNQPARPRKSPNSTKDADTVALERSLTNQLGLGVTIESKGKGGKLTISFGNLDQLDELIAILHR
ncbi:MAG: ParB/RepB/Spo0J family partition protein [Rhodospirillales bacterium]|nr:ParB/RepB/Spo0J family partition protein [Rhodospirillales bacterium]